MGELDNACIFIEKIDGLTKIEKLQYDKNEEVYKLAFNMIEKFFNDDEVRILQLYSGWFRSRYFACGKPIKFSERILCFLKKFNFVQEGK